MFLTENYGYDEVMTADPAYSMELVQEATEEWNDLCMKMIKLEHSAIVSEDGGLLQEGMEDFKKKASEVAKRVYNKFMEYLERVRVEWSKIQAAVATKFIRPDVVSQLTNMVELNKGNKFNCKAEYFIGQNLGKRVIGEIQSITWEQTKSADVTSILKATSQSLNDTTENEVKLTTELVKGAINFLKNRAQTVKAIQKLKTEGTKAYKKDLEQLAKENRGAERLNITMFQRACNKLIIAVNKITSAAIKICNACKRNASGSQKTKAKKLAKGISRGTASASILDMY